LGRNTSSPQTTIPVFYTPLEQAAYLHEAGLLRLLIEKAAPYPRHKAFATNNRGLIYNVSKDGKLPPGVTVLNGVPEMVKAAIDGSDRYSLLIRHGDRYRSQMRRTFKILGTEMEYVTFTLGVDNEGRTPLYYAAVRGYDEAVECILQYMNGVADVNVPYRPLVLTPICEAIKKIHRSMFRNLLKHHAQLEIKVDNPACTGKLDWGLLHVAAQSVVGGDLTVAKELIKRGVSIDGYGTEEEPSESPLCVAIESNQFEFTDLLRSSGARINALSNFISRPQIQLKLATTIFGRVIAANMRYSSHKIRYLLYPRGEVAALEQPAFVVEPDNGYTALHWCLIADEVIEDSGERDKEVHDEIFALLVEKFDSKDELNRKTKNSGRTALHFAASKGNRKAVEQLLEYEADSLTEDFDGKTPLELAVGRLENLERQQEAQRTVDEAQSIVKRLTESFESND
jgi:ankyrin repeat protein